jgi:hypothetical protein
MECVICKSNDINVLVQKDNKSMLSDGRVIDLPLKKYICNNCNFIFNKDINIDLEKFYKSYEIYALKTENLEHNYIIDGKEVNQSDMYFSWILKISKKYIANIKSVLEIDLFFWQHILLFL